MCAGEEGVPQCFLRHRIGGLMVMCRQVAHGPDIHLLGSLGQAAEWEILDQTLAQWGQGYTSCTGGVIAYEVPEVESLYAGWHILQDGRGRRVGKTLRGALRSTWACRRPPIALYL